MSAISGFVRFDDGPIDRGAAERVANVMSVYGADGRRLHVERDAAFVWNGFFVCPEDRYDLQPLVRHESALTVLFDGRVDNRDELADLLSLPRSELPELADSFLVACLVEQFGARVPDMLRGDFAMAVWDSRRKKLWLARDPVGVRPLFWHAGPGFAVFSSMPKGLFCFPGVAKQLNRQYLEDYLLLLPADGDKSLFDGVHRVMPGGLVTLSERGVGRTRYFDYQDVKQLRFASDGEYVEAFKASLERAVRRRLRSASPVASYLSSGFDSSTVSACAAWLLAETDQVLTCYTSAPAEGFELKTDGPFHVDEAPGAAAVAQMYPNIDHRVLRTGRLSPFRDLEEMVELLDRPPLNLCNSVWVNEIQRTAARGGNKVLLSGSLGNATISYDGVPHLAELLKSLRWIEWARIVRPYLRTKRLDRLRFFAIHSLGPLMPRWLWVFLETRAGRGFQSDPSAYTAVKDGRNARKRLDRRARELGWDLSYRPSSNGLQKRIDLLSRIDIGEYSMLANARGVDQRAPTLDRDLVEFCLGIPEGQYVGGRHFRWILIRAMQGRLPREILYPRSSGLQAADWFVGASAEVANLKDMVKNLSENQSVREVIELEDLAGLVENWPGGDWGTHAVDQAYRFKLLRGLTMGEFVRYHSYGNR
ncbi:MAG: asparagine synthetase B family protein [Wenzhouxiangella sp.]